jgi:hypothetical protein
MAALLPNDVLRRHGMPAAFTAELDRPDAFAASHMNRHAGVRARPAACWHFSADGRPICQWVIGAQASLDLSPS